MGQKVSGFFKDVAKVAAKGATSFVLGKVPVVGGMLADKINSLYKHGGMIHPYAEGGTIAGMPTQAINTPAQLMSVIKKFPEIAEKNDLSVQDVKEAVAEQKEAVKRRGGKAKKQRKRQEESESDEEDMVLLHPARAHGGRIPHGLAHHAHKMNLAPSMF